MVSDILSSAFSKMQIFLKKFQPILEIYWRNKQAQLHELMNERLKNPVETLENVIKLFNYHHDLFTKNIPNTADIGLIQLDSKSARSKIQPTPHKFKEELHKFIPEVIHNRLEEYKKWLTVQSRNLDKKPGDVEEFVEQTAFFNKASDHFQGYRDKVDILSQMIGKMEENDLKVKREDQDLLKETQKSISDLATIMQEVESKQEGERNKFRQKVSKMVPALDAEINELFAKCQDKKFLNGENMERTSDILKDLDEIEEHFKQHELGAVRMNEWQQVLETQPTVFENLDSCREEMTLRCEMWRSLHSWQEKEVTWYDTPFSQIEAQDIKIEAEKYFKVAMKLEKNLEPNLIQEKLKTAVETFKEAMPIVIALRSDKLLEAHWQQIKELIKEDFDINAEDFTLRSLINLDVNQYKEEICAIQL